MIDMPPSRYKVVERGRRLVVIDTRTGQPAVREAGGVGAARQPRPPRRPVETSASRRIDDSSGAAVLTTAPFYDLKAPRQIVMDDRFNEVIGKAMGAWFIGAIFAIAIALMFQPWLLAVPVALLFQGNARAAIRRWITARLDAVDQAGD